ncbi:MAG: hypothetical protein P8X42_15685 [Calditrichaceae bacterium]
MSDRHKKRPEEKIEKNLLLKAKIALKSGESHHLENDDLPLDMENAFLQNILDFENVPVLPVSEILSTRAEDWPDEKDIDNEELEEKVVILNALLQKHNILLSLNEDLPLRVLYTYLTRDFLNQTITRPTRRFIMYIDGCDGNCESCFQLPYCDSGQQIMNDN